MAGVIETIRTLANNFKRVAQRGSFQIIKDEVSTNQYLLNLATELLKDQLSKGEDSDGNRIKEGYSESHTKARSNKGRQTVFVDYNFTGKFYNSIYTSVHPEPKKFIYMVSRESHFKHVLGHYKKYGGFSNIKKLMDLNSQNTKKFNSELKPIGLKRIKNELFRTK